MFEHEPETRRHMGVVNRRLAVLLTVGTTALATEYSSILLAEKVLRILVHSSEIRTCSGYLDEEDDCQS